MVNSRVWSALQCRRFQSSCLALGNEEREVLENFGSNQRDKIWERYFGSVFFFYWIYRKRLLPEIQIWRSEITSGRPLLPTLFLVRALGFIQDSPWVLYACPVGSVAIISLNNVVDVMLLLWQGHIASYWAWIMIDSSWIIAVGFIHLLW